jgi:3-dehydroquinate synthetase
MNALARDRGIMNRDEETRVRDLIVRLGLLPRQIPKPEEIARYLILDKKREGGRLIEVVPGPLGRWRRMPLQTEELVRKEYWSWRNAAEV